MLEERRHAHILADDILIGDLVFQGFHASQASTTHTLRSSIAAPPKGALTTA